MAFQPTTFVASIIGSIIVALLTTDSVYHEHLPVSRSGHRVRAFLRTGLAGYRRISRDKHYEYRIRRSQSVEETQAEQEWYSDAANLGRQVRRQWERNFEEPDEAFFAYNEMRSKMNLLADQIETHAGNASGLDVSEEVVEKLEETASACR